MIREHAQHCGEGRPQSSLRVRRFVPPDGDEETAEITRWFERMATAEDWQPSGELRAYHPRSVYLGLYEGQTREGNASQTLVGALQIVLPNTAPSAFPVLPCHRVWPELRCDPEEPILPAAHVLVLAVAADWRRTGVYWQLCLALWRYAVEAGIRELWMEATPTMLRCYRLLGLPLVVRGELRTHWGEPCYPCSLSVREVAGALAEKALVSSTYRRLLAQAVSDVADADVPPAAA